VVAAALTQFRTSAGSYRQRNTFRDVIYVIAAT
jgi:hypothetical protein